MIRDSSFFYHSYIEGGKATTPVWLPDHKCHKNYVCGIALHLDGFHTTPFRSSYIFSLTLNANCRLTARFFYILQISWYYHDMNIFIVYFFLSNMYVYWLPGAIVARIPIKRHFWVKYDLRQCAHPVGLPNHTFILKTTSSMEILI